MTADPLIAIADGPDNPGISPAEVCEMLGLRDPQTLIGWTVEDTPWLADLEPGRTRSIMGGYGLTAAIADGRVTYLPVRLASVPRLLAGALRPNVAVVSGCWRGDRLVFRGSVGWAAAAAANADVVVVEVDAEAPDIGAPEIPGRIGPVVDRQRQPRPVVRRAPTPADEQIGAHVRSLLPEGATLQLGIGGIADAVLGQLDRPVTIWSGLVSDGLVDLDERGLLEGTATTTYVWGGSRLLDLAAAGRLRVVPVEQSHDLGALRSLQRFVTVNAAVEVALDGSVNVERSGGRVVGGIGGHADFCAAAALGRDALSVVAVRAEHAGRSTIQRRVEVVSTGRSDVDVVVTEHGIADLRGLGDTERAERLIAVAAPHHRDGLRSTLDRIE
ncbi:MAG: putative acetyl-CoA hydrolase/transferase [Acidimicrobiales bacterium]|nr:putative acetyl-CoA hydrolase/transferase [Acidimicrobiales bacterium]